MSFTVSEQQNYVRIDFDTDPSAELVLEVQQRVSEDYPAVRRLYCLNDSRFLLTVPELKALADAALALSNPPDRIAIVTDHEPSYETARVHRLYRSQQGTEERIFRTEQDAIDWLSETGG